MAHNDSPLAATLKGAVAGLAGTAALVLAMKATPQVAQALGMASEEAPRPAESAAETTRAFADKVATGMVEAPIAPEAREAAGEAVHWTYGAAWGALYGILQSSLRLPPPLHGTAFGAIVGAVASTALPAMRLAPSPTKQPPAMSALQAGYHVLYGWVVAATFHALSADT